MPAISTVLSLLALLPIALLLGCASHHSSPEKRSDRPSPPPPAATSALDATATNATPPPAIQAWMDRLTVPHFYDPATGFIVARETTALPPLLSNAPPLDEAIAEAGEERLVIVFVTADRCAPCQQYKQPSSRGSPIRDGCRRILKSIDRPNSPTRISARVGSR